VCWGGGGAYPSDVCGLRLLVGECPHFKLVRQAHRPTRLRYKEERERGRATAQGGEHQHPIQAPFNLLCWIHCQLLLCTRRRTLQAAAQLVIVRVTVPRRFGNLPEFRLAVGLLHGCFELVSHGRGLGAGVLQWCRVGWWEGMAGIRVLVSCRER
jgi:hypothetical protein